jgi:hypothetical protein
MAARVGANLLDLLTITRESVVLPLTSLSLKVVEDSSPTTRKTSKERGRYSDG